MFLPGLILYVILGVIIILRGWRMNVDSDSCKKLWCNKNNKICSPNSACATLDSGGGCFHEEYRYLCKDEVRLIEDTKAWTGD